MAIFEQIELFIATAVVAVTASVTASVTFLPTDIQKQRLLLVGGVGISTA